MYKIDISVSSDTDAFSGSCAKLSTIYIIKLLNNLYNKKHFTRCTLEHFHGKHGDSYSLFAAELIRT